jgi:hypothetical protein
MTFKYIRGRTTGIYREDSWSAEGPAAINEVFMGLRDAWDFSLQLERIEKEACEVFSKNCPDRDWRKPLPQLTDPIVKDAKAVLELVSQIRDSWSGCARQYSQTDCLNNILIQTLSLADARHRMEIRPLEEERALRGVKEIEDSKKGSAAVLERRQYELERTKCRKDANDLKSKRPDLSWNAIAKILAPKFGVSPRTILRRTKTPA